MKSGLTPISKETELGDLRIGQPVDLYIDMYGGRHVFKGRIFRLYHGDRIDIGLAAAGERYRQFHQGGAAPAGSDRPYRLRSRREPAVYPGTSVTPTSTLTGRPPDPMPVSSCRHLRLNHKPAVRPKNAPDANK